MRRQIVVFVLLLVCLIFTSGQNRPAGSSSLPIDCDKGINQACGYNVQITVVPALPTQDDIIQVISSGDWYDSCIPYYYSHQIINNLIRVDAVAYYNPGVWCLQVITPWEFTINIGGLPSGFYQVNLYIGGAPCATRSFTVLHRIYLPIITKRIAIHQSF